MFIKMIFFSRFWSNLLDYVFNNNIFDRLFCQIFWTINQTRKAEKDMYLLIILFKKFGKKSEKNISLLKT